MIYISPMMDEQTRAIPIRAIIPNPAQQLKPYMFGEMLIPVQSTRRSIAVPASAIQSEAQMHYVFVVLSDTVFEKRDVTLGTRYDGWTEIQNGLSTRDRIVTTGSFELKAEMLKASFGEEE
jgi:multidrug efflux pump subunit AcrA (membrane-fusion protein)